MAARAREPLRRGSGRDDRPELSPARRAAHRDRRRAHRAAGTRGGVLALRRALGKSHPRVAAVDDGAFARGDRRAPVAAVIVALPDRLEAVRVGSVRVDGTDGTRRVLALLRALGSWEGVRAVLLDGAVVGGFNVLDLGAIARAVRVPVVAVTRRPPDFARIAAALRRWFPRTARRRLATLRRHRLAPVPTGAEPILAAAVGCTAQDAAGLVRRTAVQGFWPEPLRLAHLIASSGYASGADAVRRRRRAPAAADLRRTRSRRRRS